MKLIMIVLIFTGIVLIMANQLAACSRRPTRVEYRYLPRDLDTYLRTEPLASARLGGMFENETVRPAS
jgi:hypothetical protein